MGVTCEISATEIQAEQPCFGFTVTFLPGTQAIHVADRYSNPDG